MYWFPTFKFSALILNHLVNSDSLNSLFYFFMHKVREVKAVNKNEKPDMKRLIKQSPYTVMLKDSNNKPHLTYGYQSISAINSKNAWTETICP